MADRDSSIEAGIIAKPHGIVGEVIAEVKRDLVGILVADIEVALRKRGGAERVLAVERVRPHAGRLIVKFRGVDSRDDAEALRSQTVWLTREQVGPLPEGRYFVQDVLGLEVYTDLGELLGRVDEILSMPANDVYIVRGGGEEILLPVIDDVVRAVDVDAGRVVVHLMKGLRREG